MTESKDDDQKSQQYSDPFKNSATEAMSAITDFWMKAAKNLSAFNAHSAEINREVIDAALKSAGDPLDPLKIGELLGSTAGKLVLDPDPLVHANLELLENQQRLWAYAVQRLNGEEPDPVAEPDKSDRRFRSDKWREELVFDVMKQNYLLTSRWIVDVLSSAEGIDTKTRDQVRFYARQFSDALSPTNFAATNPEVLERAIDSQGESVAAGAANLRRDMAEGKLNIRQVDPDAFSLGTDIATTPGSVVFENDLMQLIQYTPTTIETYKVPLIIVPPWINKFYILDLKPENSFIRWAVEQGLTVFVISWRNPGTEHSQIGFEDYMRMGILDSLDAVKAATGQEQVNAIGYCIGGTLLALTLAWMAAKRDDRIRAATFFTTQVDFSEPGDLGVFIDEEQVAAVDQLMAETGYLDGADMARTFNMLRSNDLIWSFWINNYLLGKDSTSFDLLYWNSDSTRVPRATHRFYLEQMYLKNNLVKPGAIEIDGEKIDLSKITIPVYLQATRDDHIAPWKSVIKAKQYFNGPIKFVLAGSGHIAGVINPPAVNKYQYWVNGGEPVEADAWLDGAEEVPGSWWPDWKEWAEIYSGDLVTARMPGECGLEVIEPAPGRYVRE